MTIKLKAPRAWMNKNEKDVGFVKLPDEIRVRIVRESDWRKMMKLVRACEVAQLHGTDKALDAFDAALNALKGAK